METIFIILLIALPVGVFIALMVRAEKKRRLEWMAKSLELDLKYQASELGFDRRFAAFKLFNQGHSRQAKNILSGVQRGSEVILADYYYTTGSGKNSHTHAQTVCILRSPELDIPHCFLRRQNRVLDFLGKLFGGQDINFTSDPEFSKTFVLQGCDEEATAKLFSPEVRQHFMSFGDTGIQFEGLGDTLVLHFGRKIKPEQVHTLLEQAFSMHDLFARRHGID